MNKTEKLISNKESILLKYKNGLTIKMLANEYNVSTSLMRNFLLKNNVKIIHNTKKRLFDENFFFTPSRELAYFMGFCLADGSITSQKNHRSSLEISVHYNDVSVLEQFCNWTKYDIKYISKRKNTNMVRLCFNSKIFKQDFSQWGLVNNKTYLPVIPNISSEYITPFLIGYIDGDGSIKISKKHNSFNIVGNRLLIDWFIYEINKLGFNKNFKFEDKVNAIWKRARLYRKNLILELVNCLDIKQYQDILLKRKWINFL